MYDATETYKRKNLMAPIAVTDLKNGDIVLVEFFVTRWIPKDEPNGVTSGAVQVVKGKPKRARREWKKWNVEFRLDAISLLFAGSKYVVEEVKEDEDFEC